jgi:thiol:disulfide interchange protein/DsbC/DsbD-like thiol-disulfide interchange protein
MHLPQLLTLLLAMLAITLAQPAQAANHMTVELVAEGPAKPGGTIELALAMTPEQGWHGYWSNPGDAGYAMELDWSLPAEWKAGELQYPVPQTLLIGGLMNHVYEGPYTVLAPLNVPIDAAPGPHNLSIKLRYLVCTPELCVPEEALLAASVMVGSEGARDPRFDAWRAAIPPVLDRKASFELADGRLRIGIPLPSAFEIRAPHLFLANKELIEYAAPQEFRRSGDLLTISLKLKSASASAPKAVSGILKLDDAGNGIDFDAGPGAVPAGGDMLAGSGAPALPALWLLVLLALGGGLLLNIMPCVFPILSLKAMSLARAGESDADARHEGLSYTAGVVLACLALGALVLALRAAGSEIGWAFQLQEPGVVVFLLVLATAITANFAGLFELPSLSITREGKPLGAFATGLLAAFVATPCTGPFMATAMGAALLLPTWQGMLIFGLLGLGIALPFLLLGYVPALRKLLPRPGKWMETFRKIMAVPMGLTALALLWLVWRLGGAHFAFGALGTTTLVLAGLLLTWGPRPHIGPVRRYVGAGFVALGLVFGIFLLRDYAPSEAAAEASIIPTQPFSEAALDKARASGKPVFVWFTADWCLTCKVNESVAIEREATRDAFKKAGVIALKGDWTRRDPDITRFLTAHGAGGIPLYMWYKPGGEAEQLPQVLTPDSLVTLAAAS